MIGNSISGWRAIEAADVVITWHESEPHQWIDDEDRPAGESGAGGAGSPIAASLPFRGTAPMRQAGPEGRGR